MGNASASNISVLLCFLLPQKPGHGLFVCCFNQVGNPSSSTLYGWIGWHPTAPLPSLAGTLLPSPSYTWQLTASFLYDPGLALAMPASALLRSPPGYGPHLVGMAGCL